MATAASVLIKEPIRTMVIVGFCLELRRLELAGLKWSDFDWTKQELLIQRGVTVNRVDAVKTRRSKPQLPLNPSVVAVR
jgi:integrase